MPKQRNSGRNAGRSAGGRARRNARGAHDSSSNDGEHDIGRLSLLDPVEQERVDFAHLGLGDVTLIPTENIFRPRSMADLENPVFHILDLLRNPANFAYTAKAVFNVELGPMQTVILRELWVRPFPMLIGSRGLSKSFCLALYCLFRALFCQGSKIVIIGSAFRTSKVIFDYCETIWRNAPIFRDIIGHDCVPRRENDRCSLRVGESVITALPLGTGEKIRGQRASVLVCDEFGTIRRDIFENVVSGFAAVSLSPVDKMKQVARLRALKEMGKMEQEQELVTVPGLNSNQLVISGTAYYRFNHFYQEYERYKKIIESRGDRRKLEELFGGEVPEKFNHKDFSVMRIPVGLIPEGFMDDKNIARARVTYHRTQFLMEMAACLVPTTMVVTPYGTSPIEKIQVGDLVLTHRGRFRPVTETFVRQYDGEIVGCKTYGYGEQISVTPEHTFWTKGESWEAIDTLKGDLHLACLQELSGLQSIDVRDYDDDYSEAPGGQIYPRHSQTKLTRKQIRAIADSTDTYEATAEKHGVSLTCVWTIKKKRRTPKTAIKPTVPLNYDFGLMVGYYAAEGSTGKNNIEFALDGHVNAGLEGFVSELCGAVKNVFGLKAKQYYGEDNVCRVVVCQRLVASLFRKICPGVAATKRVEPKILFSNPDFLKGFLVGYWNGDGHRRAHGPTIATATSSSQGLLSQVRTALSYFDIGSTMSAARRNKQCVIRGRTYNSNPFYTLGMSGENARAFFDIFYGEKVGVNKRSGMQAITVSENAIHLPIVEKVRRHYAGPVYNLEVAEDNSYSLLNATVHNCFPVDSDGFYKMSLIQRCVVGAPENPVCVPSCGPEPVDFRACLSGQRDRSYVFSVDPASERDNCAITILEVWPDHRRVVYCWTTTRKRHKARLAKNLVKEHDFFKYVARHIRTLMKLFPCVRIALDKMGGGVSILEALADPANCQEGELPVLPVIEEGVEKYTDRVPGEHIIEEVKFASADWVADANNGLKFDLETRSVLFPSFDGASLGLAIEDDKMQGRVVVNEDGTEDILFDTLEDCVMNIEEMKEELASIVCTETPGGNRNRWDTPEGSTINGKKVKSKKDRYCALLMANMAARSMKNFFPPAQYYSTGGFARDVCQRGPEPRPRGHFNPPWYTAATSGKAGAIVTRHGGGNAGGRGAGAGRGQGRR